MSLTFIPVRTATGVEYYSPTDIIRCEASSNYTLVYVNGKKPFLVSKTLATYEHKLVAFDFVRIHHSNLINKAFIAKVNKNGTVVLTDGSVHNMSKRRKSYMVRTLQLSAAG